MVTATFDVGNEPTVTQIDRLLTQFPNSWFDGTQNLFLAKWALQELRRLDNDKANKNQENWITPTLINGWIGYDANSVPQYRKDEFGKVTICGMVKSGANIIFVLPNGYRQIIAPRFATIAKASIDYLSIYTYI